jgi:hypothetical protein
MQASGSNLRYIIARYNSGFHTVATLVIFDIKYVFLIHILCVRKLLGSLTNLCY